MELLRWLSQVVKSDLLTSPLTRILAYALFLIAVYAAIYKGISIAIKPIFNNAKVKKFLKQKQADLEQGYEQRHQASPINTGLRLAASKLITTFEWFYPPQTSPTTVSLFNKIESWLASNLGGPIKFTIEETIATLRGISSTAIAVSICFAFSYCIVTMLALEKIQSKSSFQVWPLLITAFLFILLPFSTPKSASSQLTRSKGLSLDLLLTSLISKFLVVWAIPALLFENETGTFEYFPLFIFNLCLLYILDYFFTKNQNSRQSRAAHPTQKGSINLSWILAFFMLMYGIFAMLASTLGLGVDLFRALNSIRICDVTLCKTVAYGTIGFIILVSLLIIESCRRGWIENIVILLAPKKIAQIFPPAASGQASSNSSFAPSKLELIFITIIVSLIGVTFFVKTWPVVDGIFKQALETGKDDFQNSSSYVPILLAGVVAIVTLSMYALLCFLIVRLSYFLLAMVFNFVWSKCQKLTFSPFASFSSIIIIFLAGVMFLEYVFTTLPLSVNQAANSMPRFVHLMIIFNIVISIIANPALVGRPNAATGFSLMFTVLLLVYHGSIFGDGITRTSASSESKSTMRGFTQHYQLFVLVIGNAFLDLLSVLITAQLVKKLKLKVNKFNSTNRHPINHSGNHRDLCLLFFSHIAICMGMCFCLFGATVWFIKFSLELFPETSWITVSDVSGLICGGIGFLCTDNLNVSRLNAYVGISVIALTTSVPTLFYLAWLLWHLVSIWSTAAPARIFRHLLLEPGILVFLMSNLLILGLSSLVYHFGL